MLKRNEQGQDPVEYALLLVLIAAAAVLVLTARGTTLGALYSQLRANPSAASASLAP